MRTRTTRVVAIVAPLLFACMDGSWTYAQTKADGNARSTPVQINGLSVLPPGGPGWVRVPDHDPSQVEFFKQAGDSTYLLNAELRDLGGMSLSNADDVLAYLRTALKESPRQENMKSSFAIETTVGAACASFDMRAEDSHSPRRPGVTFDIEVHGLYCLHPKASGVMAIMEYSRRARKGKAHAGERSERGVHQRRECH